MKTALQKKDISLQYTVILEPAEEGGYTATVPMLPGCITEGDSYEETMDNIKDAIELYTDVLKEKNEEIPQEPNNLSFNKVEVFVKI